MREIYEKNREVILYLLFGGIAFMVNVSIFASLTAQNSWGALEANVIAWVICVIFQFVTNRMIVFKTDNKKIKEIARDFTLFVGSCLLTLGMEELIIWVFIVKLVWNSILVKLAAQILTIITNYILRKHIIFKG